MFCFKYIKIFSLMEEIGAYYTTLQQLKHLKVKKKKNPHKSCLIFGSRMFSTDVHVCISIVLYIYPLTHQCHPFIIFKASGFPSHLYKSMPVFHWNKLVLILLSLLSSLNLLPFWEHFILFSVP